MKNSQAGRMAAFLLSLVLLFSVVPKTATGDSPPPQLIHI